jgi:predicted lipase
MVDLSKKETIVKLAQECINSYGGEYGVVVPVLQHGTRYEIEHTEFSVGFLDKQLVICFEGTCGWIDWKDNFEFKETKMESPYNTKGKIQVHSGFYRQYLVVRDKIHEIVRQWIETETISGIIVTGHSLGGALATLCAVDLQFNFEFPIGVVTFGSPRVGNKSFAVSFNRRLPDSIRFVHKNDMVCKVPVFLYWHVDKEVRLGTRPWYRPIAFLIGNPWDHYPAQYMDAILKDPRSIPQMRGI